MMSPKSIAALITALVAAGCGSSSEGALFGNPGVGSRQSGGRASFGSGGSGDLGSGGTTSAGAFTPGSGGAPASGGADVGSGGDEGVGGGNPTGCDFGGTWASYIRVPVTWPASPAVIFAGTGELQQWNISHQKMHGFDVSVDTRPCGIFLPDLQSDFLAAYAKFGIRFPDQLFDLGDIPITQFVFHGRTEASGFGFDTDPFAIVLGTTLTNPTTVPWPPVAQLQLVDHDTDQKPGITVVPAPGMGYSFPPSDLSGGLADLIYIAERTVSRLSGEIVSCDEMHASVEIVDVNGKTGINSTVVGCRKTNGTECAAADAAFIDANRPVYEASGPGTMVSVRLAPSATCADVRRRFPKL